MIVVYIYISFQYFLLDYNPDPVIYFIKLQYSYIVRVYHLSILLKFSYIITYTLFNLNLDTGLIVTFELYNNKNDYY